MNTWMVGGRTNSKVNPEPSPAGPDVVGADFRSQKLLEEERKAERVPLVRRPSRPAGGRRPVEPPD
jgi:hypothetical protein